MKAGYCCNVHGGRTLDEVKTNLQKHATAVRSTVAPDSQMPIGLWLSQSAIDGLGSANATTRDATLEFSEWLAHRSLEPFTLNGFPLGDFHQEVVKRQVYLPTWASKERLDYTLKLAEIQEVLLSANAEHPGFQSISTLPLGWPPVARAKLFTDGRDFLQSCAKNLKELARQLDQQRNRCGVHTMVCLEPEPGCVFDRSEEICRYFREFLFDGNSVSAEIVRTHIGVCHDVCHSAVMFENQNDAVANYKNAGIRVGKVQISSAIKCQFDMDVDANSKRIQQLSSFTEQRYLHQTKIKDPEGNYSFFEDLPQAISAIGKRDTCGEEWRVHFHVPIFATELGRVQSTQDEISQFLSAIKEHDLDIEHFEIETYAWNVLPAEFNEFTDNLAAGISRELQWFAGVSQTEEA